MDTNTPTLFALGAVGILPTDTVYGLVARAQDKKAVAKLYALKSRESKPGTIIAANQQQLIDLGLDKEALEEAGRFWPASISAVIPCVIKLDYLDQGVGSLAVRIPDDAKLRQLLKVTGPLITTSANAPNEPTANTIAEARQYFGDKVDFYVDGGNLSGRKPSTVIRFSNGKLEVLRKGAVEIRS